MNQVDPWSPPSSDPTGPLAKFYVAVAGNSGTGKSTLISRLGNDLNSRGDVAVIDERSTHHPFLDRLFHDPKEYAFELQLNFMLQRSMIIRRWLSTGKSLIMERSHLDDVVFIRHLQIEGLVTKAQMGQYLSLWNLLDQRTPKPTLLIALDASPEESIVRITEAESSGKRPREFPDEERKILWVTRWHSLYLERFEELWNNQEVTMARYSSNASYEQILEECQRNIQEQM